MEISTKDLRSHTRELFSAIERGEEIILTYHGKPRARITGLQQDNNKIAKVHPAYGIWKEREDMSSPEKYVRDLRKGRQF